MQAVTTAVAEKATDLTTHYTATNATRPPTPHADAKKDKTAKDITQEKGNMVSPEVQERNVASGNVVTQADFVVFGVSP